MNTSIPAADVVVKELHTARLCGSPTNRLVHLTLILHIETSSISNQCWVLCDKEGSFDYDHTPPYYNNNPKKAVRLLFDHTTTESRL